MNNLFIDTSSHFKLYHHEEGTREILEFFNSHQINSIFISEITRIEFCSAVWKKRRKLEITEEQASLLIDNFESDLIKFRTINQTDKVLTLAKNLVSSYWKSGLRTLDSLQLASAIMFKEADFFITSDKLLAEVAEEEHLNVLLI